jgi:hypothetical protein
MSPFPETAAEDDLAGGITELWGSSSDQNTSRFSTQSLNLSKTDESSTGATALGGEDPPAYDALASFDLALGEDAVAFASELDGAGCRRGVTERLRREGLSMLGVEPSKR